MKRHLEFFAGVIILFLMAVVLWKFIEPAPVTKVESPSPVEQVPESGQLQNPVVEVPETPPAPSVPGEVPTAPLPPIGEQPVACTMDAKMCPDGTYVGRVGPNCEFAPCGEGGEEHVQYCGPRSDEAMACIDLYAPVCGQVQVECVTTPCNPVPQTFGNSCYACVNERVISYVEGACEDGQGGAN